MRSWRQTIAAAAGGGCARHGLHASAAARATRRCATATRCSATSRVTTQHPVRDRSRLAGQPGGAQARPVPRRWATRRRAGRRSCGCTAAASAAATRPTRCRSTWRSTFAKQGYVVGLDQLPAARLRLRRATRASRPARSRRSRRSTTPRRRSAGCAVTPASSASTPTRIGIGGESAGGITATLVGLHSEDPGGSGNPGFPSTVRGFVSISGGLPERRSSRARATRSACSSTAPPTAWCPYQWSDATTAAMLDAGVPALAAAPGRRGPRALRRSTARSTSSRRDYFLYLALDLAHAAGQPTSAARAYGRQLRTAGREPAGEATAEQHPQLRRLEKRARALAH